MDLADELEVVYSLWGARVGFIEGKAFKLGLKESYFKGS